MDPAPIKYSAAKLSLKSKYYSSISSAGDEDEYLL